MTSPLAPGENIRTPIRNGPERSYLGFQPQTPPPNTTGLTPDYGQKADWLSQLPASDTSSCATPTDSRTNKAIAGSHRPNKRARPLSFSPEAGPSQAEIMPAPSVTKTTQGTHVSNVRAASCVKYGL